MVKARRAGLVTTLTLVATALAGAEEPAALSPRQVVERAGAAVVLIESGEGESASLGSGFLVDRDGALVTNLHVIDGAGKLTVTLHDGTRLEDVAVRAFDVERDLAVLTVALPAGASKWTVADLGDTADVEPGARILVIGNPLGLERTVTEGIVSAWREGESSEELSLPPSRLLQISAAISPGSSGGPVFDERGRVIGVATAGVLWGVAGLNFAVPIDDVPALLAEDAAMDLVTFRERVDDVRRELARPYYDDGRNAYDRGNPEEAAKRLEKALRLFPRYEDALLLSGRISLETGRIELAEQRFDQAVKVDRYNPEAWCGLGRTHRVRALADNDTVRLARAEEALERALGIDPRHARAAYELAVIQIARGAVDRARQLLESAVDNEAGFVDALYMLGELHLRLGRPAAAQEQFEKALWDDPDHAPSHFGMARLYMDRERTMDGGFARHGRAAHHWERFLELSEGDPSMEEARQVALSVVRQYFPHLLDR